MSVAFQLATYLRFVCINEKQHPVKARYLECPLWVNSSQSGSYHSNGWLRPEADIRRSLNQLIVRFHLRLTDDNVRDPQSERIVATGIRVPLDKSWVAKLLVILNA